MATPTSPGIRMAPTAGSAPNFRPRRRSRSRGRSSRQAIVMPGLVPGIHVLRAAWLCVDGREKPGPDGLSQVGRGEESLLLLQLRQRARAVILGRRVAHLGAGVDGVEHRGILGL